MKARNLWRVSVDTSPEGEAPVTMVLSEFFKQGVASYTHIETARTRVSVWLPDRRQITAAALQDLKTSIQTRAGRAAKLLRARISVSRVRDEDWAESWKRHFKVLEIGSKLLISPPWIRRRPKPGQTMLVLNPGLSFGTGQHPTTAFCLEQIVRRRALGSSQSFLDIGTGSGILALAAARLGYGPVVAFDFDPDAIRCARANAQANKLSRVVRPVLGDVRQLSLSPGRRYSLVCANLISDLLIAKIDLISAQVAPDGVLVLAGILRREFDTVVAACEAQRLKRVACRSVGEWRSGTFAWARLSP